MTASQTTASHEVGYGRPPTHTRFQKGRSGNPGGRPRRPPAERLKRLALHEAYRTTVVMEDGHAVPMPAIQAVLRSQLQLAASGNARAQRDVLAMIRHIELVDSVLGESLDDDVDADAGEADNIGDGADDGEDDGGGDSVADADTPAQQQASEPPADDERQNDGAEPAAPPAVSAAPERRRPAAGGRAHRHGPAAKTAADGGGTPPLRTPRRRSAPPSLPRHSRRSPDRRTRRIPRAGRGRDGTATPADPYEKSNIPC